MPKWLKVHCYWLVGQLRLYSKVVGHCRYFKSQYKSIYSFVGYWSRRSVPSTLQIHRPHHKSPWHYSDCSTSNSNSSVWNPRPCFHWIPHRCSISLSNDCQGDGFRQKSQGLPGKKCLITLKFLFVENSERLPVYLCFKTIWRSMAAKRHYTTQSRHSKIIWSRNFIRRWHYSKCWTTCSFSRFTSSSATGQTSWSSGSGQRTSNVLWTLHNSTFIMFRNWAFQLIWAVCFKTQLFLKKLFFKIGKIRTFGASFTDSQAKHFHEVDPDINKKITLPNKTSSGCSWFRKSTN